jgi:uncharacterized protein (TIGR02117 family)
MYMIRICILLLACSCSACAAPFRNTLASAESEPHKTIYLISHGWHAGILLRHSDITDSAWPIAEDFPTAQYLEVGWGDRDYYQTADPHLGILIKAALLPTASVLHIVGFNDAVSAYFPFNEIIRIDLSHAGFTQLVRAITASFALDEAGKAHSLSSGLYGDSRFYLSAESYHLFNTCNVWVARALRDAGLPITPARTISTTSLMTQARKFGVVVQARPQALH